MFRHVYEVATGELEEPRPGAQYFGGLDLAKTEDYTVLCIVHATERRVVYFDRFRRIDWEAQIQRVRVALERYNDATVWVDTTGAGEPIFESMARAGMNVSPFSFTAKSKDALINNLAILLERKMLTIPRPELAPVLVDELESYQYSVTEQGRVRTSAPQGQHDDAVIGLALSVWSFAEDRGPLRIYAI